MTTKTKQVLQLKVTLQDEALESWQGLSDILKGANTPSIIRMALISYYKQLKKTNTALLENIIDNGKPDRITKDEMEDVMADWWQSNKANIRQFTNSKKQ